MSRLMERRLSDKIFVNSSCRTQALLTRTNSKHLLKTMNNDFVIDVLTNTVALWNLKPCYMLASRKSRWNVFIHVFPH